MIALRRSSGPGLSTVSSDIDLTPYDRLDAVRSGVIMKLDRTKQISVVSQGHCRHLQLGRSFDHIFNTVGSVQQTEITM
jgi:hypothetical protein